MVRVPYIELRHCLPELALCQTRPERLLLLYGRYQSRQARPKIFVELLNARSEDPDCEDGGAEILLVDDDAADVELTKESMSKYKFVNRINVVSDGIEAINYLHL